MKESVLVIWGVVVFICAFAFAWIVKYYKRKMNKYVAIHKIVLLLLMLGIGVLVFSQFEQSSDVTWVARLVFLIVGILHVWALYHEKWAKRDKFQFPKDGFWPELMFTILSGLLGAISFLYAPKLLGVVKISTSLTNGFWDLPLLFLLPFLVVKTLDLASQIPFREIENPYVFPVEPINGQNWKWRNMMQINFQVKKSLQDEYSIFSRFANPWLEGPKEVALGDIFQLMMQIRRQKEDLQTIQDLGNEYQGIPKFCWIFSIKTIWWNPFTWFRNPRFLNPDLNIIDNEIQKYDVIMARRIPGDGKKRVAKKYTDSETTQVYQR